MATKYISVATEDKQDIIDAVVDAILDDTIKIADESLPTSPVLNSLAQFIASGGTALGTHLPASKSLYDVIALDRLDHATYGLSALNTYIRQSLCATGDPANSIGKALYELYVNRLTATRAGYLDNLKATVTTDTYSLPDGTVEQDALTFAAAIQDIEASLDMNALTQNCEVREYEQVDGTNYRQISFKTFPTDFDTGTKALTFSYKQKNRLYKITLQSVVAEGAIRDIPYAYRRENKG